MKDGGVCERRITKISVRHRCKCANQSASSCKIESYTLSRQRRPRHATNLTGMYPRRQRVRYCTNAARFLYWGQIGNNSHAWEILTNDCENSIVQTTYIGIGAKNRDKWAYCFFRRPQRLRCRNFIAKSCTSQKGVLVATHTEPCYCFTRLYSPITVARNIKLTL